MADQVLISNTTYGHMVRCQEWFLNADSEVNPEDCWMWLPNKQQQKNISLLKYSEERWLLLDYVPSSYLVSRACGTLTVPGSIFILAPNPEFGPSGHRATDVMLPTGASHPSLVPLLWDAVHLSKYHLDQLFQHLYQSLPKYKKGKEAEGARDVIVQW